MFNASPDKILAIVGPTASGKTHRAVSVAKAMGGEILSADSRQVYSGMDIGTGKDIDEYGDVPYHLIDICDPGTKYNLYRFLSDYNTALSEVISRGRQPVVCGGSGMYVEAALNGITMPAVPCNPELRKELENKSLEELAAILAQMKRLHNSTDVDTVKRAVRAIEIQKYYENHPMEAVATLPAATKKAVVVAIDIDRDSRRERISLRLKSRLHQGMVDEVKRLLDSGISADDLIYYGLEYKWVTLFVTGKISFNQMFSALETAIHQFAKRQMTWFRGMERRGWKLNWMPWDMDEDEFVEKSINLLSEIN